jgi:hypothetical protein
MATPSGAPSGITGPTSQQPVVGGSPEGLTSSLLSTLNKALSEMTSSQKELLNKFDGHTAKLVKESQRASKETSDAVKSGGLSKEIREAISAINDVTNENNKLTS